MLWLGQERKNWRLLVRGYVMEFGGDEEVALYIKTSRWIGGCVKAPSQFVHTFSIVSLLHANVHLFLVLEIMVVCVGMQVHELQP